MMRLLMYPYHDAYLHICVQTYTHIPAASTARECHDVDQLLYNYHHVYRYVCVHVNGRCSCIDKGVLSGCVPAVVWLYVWMRVAAA